MTIKVIYDISYVDPQGQLQYLLNGYHNKIKQIVTDKNQQGPIDLESIHRDIDRENPTAQWRAFVSHGNFLQYYKKHWGTNNIVLKDQVCNDGDVYIYPIEICYTLENLLDNYSLTIDNQTYNYDFLQLIDPNILAAIKQGWVKLVLNSIHDPLEHEDFLNQLEQYFIKNSIDPTNVVLIGGNKFDRYYQKYTQSRLRITSGFIIPNQIESRVKEFDIKVGSLGYKSSIVTEQDLDYDTIRSKKFICLNRNLHRPHRWVMAYFALKYNLLDNSIFSFLVSHGSDPERIKNVLLYYLGPGDYEEISKQIYNLVPYEIDTKHISNKNGFTLNNNKKEFYADTYINIVTETSFEKGDFASPFISEKTFLHPMVNLQPFIIVGNPFTLKTLKDLGFKTFHPWIDETYDSCIDYKTRMQLIEKEIQKISKMSMTQVHDLYYAMTDRLLHNQQQIMSFRNHNPFEQAFNDIRNWYGL